MSLQNASTKLLKGHSQAGLLPVGSGQRAENVGSRIISATLEDLQGLIESASSASDFFQRVLGLTID